MEHQLSLHNRQSQPLSTVSIDFAPPEEALLRVGPGLKGTLVAAAEVQGASESSPDLLRPKLATGPLSLRLHSTDHTSHRAKAEVKAWGRALCPC